MDLLDEGKREGGEWNGCCNSSKGELWWRLKWILLTQADDDEQGGERKRNQKLQIPNSKSFYKSLQPFSRTEFQPGKWQQMHV